MNSPTLSQKSHQKEKKEYIRLLSTEALVKSYQSSVENQSIEMGEQLLGEKAKLVRLPGLENIDWLCPLNLITPNPKQPREYFDPEKMAELEGTLIEVGQKEAIKVVPFLTLDGHIRLFIIDGERRFRILKKLGKETAKVSIKWEESLDDIMDTSLIMNISRAPHNPIELAKAFQRRVESFLNDPNRDQSIHPNKLVAQRYGISESQVYIHLKFLELPEEIQQLMIEKKLPNSAILALQRGRLKKQGGGTDQEKDNLRLMVIARELMSELQKINSEENPSQDGKKTKNNNRLTHAQVQKAAKRALMEQGEEGKVDAMRLDVNASVIKISTLTSKFLNHAGNLIAPEKRSTVIEGIRNLGKRTPPEVIRDRLKSIRGAITVLLELVDDAILPPPLDIPYGKPTFQNYLEKFRPEAFGPTIRYLMVSELADASDNDGGGIPITSRDLAEKIGVNEKIIGSNIRHLRENLKQFEIELDELTIRSKNNRGEYDKIPAYRLKWKKESTTNAQQTPAPITPKPTLPKVEKTLPTPKPPEKILEKFHILSNKKFNDLGQKIASIVARHPHFGTEKMQIKPLIDGRIIIALRVSGTGNNQKLVVGSNIENFDLNFKVYLAAIGAAVQEADQSFKQVGLLTLSSRNQL